MLAINVVFCTDDDSKERAEAIYVPLQKPHKKSKVTPLGNSISEYTEAQFIRVIQDIFTANRNGTKDEVLDELLDEFRIISGHPEGSDLIYWPDDEAQCNPEGITKTVKEWRAANGLPGFKQ